MHVNINPETGVAYGYISARSLVPDQVDFLLDSGHDISFDEYLGENPDDPNGYYYEQDEPLIEGNVCGVHYRSSWLGGALHFFIMESPHITDCARFCSPCVPNAGDLDNMDGTYTCYDVPANWRDEMEE